MVNDNDTTIGGWLLLFSGAMNLLGAYWAGVDRGFFLGITGVAALAQGWRLLTRHAL